MKNNDLIEALYESIGHLIFFGFIMAMLLAIMLKILEFLWFATGSELDSFSKGVFFTLIPMFSYWVYSKRDD